MPTTVSAVLVILVFIIPGFISNSVFSLVFPRTEPGDTRTILTAITFSCLNYAFLSWLLILMWKESWYRSIGMLVGIAFVALFASPVAVALAFAKMIDTEWGRKVLARFRIINPVPKAWDYFFRQAIPCWVIATLKDGRVFAGLYGENSSASSFPAEEDLYLEKLCRLSAEGKIEGVAPYSMGGIIRMEYVASLEFFESARQAGTAPEEAHEASK